MNSLYDDNGMLIVRDPSVWTWKSPRAQKLESWTKKEGSRRVCKSCLVSISAKPTGQCKSTKHIAYYQGSLKRHRKRLIERLI